MPLAVATTPIRSSPVLSTKITSALSVSSPHACVSLHSSGAVVGETSGPSSCASLIVVSTRMSTALPGGSMTPTRYLSVSNCAIDGGRPLVHGLVQLHRLSVVPVAVSPSTKVAVVVSQPTTARFVETGSIDRSWFEGSVVACMVIGLPNVMVRPSTVPTTALIDVAETPHAMMTLSVSTLHTAALATVSVVNWVTGPAAIVLPANSFCARNISRPPPRPGMRSNPVSGLCHYRGCLLIRHDTALKTGSKCSFTACKLRLLFDASLRLTPPGLARESSPERLFADFCLVSHSPETCSTAC